VHFQRKHLLNVSGLDHLATLTLRDLILFSKNPAMQYDEANGTFTKTNQTFHGSHPGAIVLPFSDGDDGNCR
jgi:hypothetical protein